MDNPEISANGTKRWFNSNGEYHRDDGPAVIYADGDKAWYQHGVRHRADDPAIIGADGTEYWYLNDNCLSFDKWLYEVDMSDEDKVMMKLKYG
jgi:hypothetical protein